jgi:PPOX class probable F420-dependent enzyme
VIGIPDSHRDLLDADFATLATISRDGHPQLSEVWFLVEEGSIKISLNTARQKVKNLSANKACTFFLLDITNPYRYLEIRADADVRPDPDYAFADRVGAKYSADLRIHDGPGDSRVVVSSAPPRSTPSI